MAQAIQHVGALHGAATLTAKIGEVRQLAAVRRRCTRASRTN